jgi:predicted ABC-class ATPase
VQLGCSGLLIDEDKSATNFMIRDKRMQMLVAKENEPITPFIYKVRF